MSIKGFNIGGVTQRYDYNALDNIPRGEGLSEEVKQALLQLAQKVAYIDDQGQTYYDDLYNALYPPRSLDSIDAVFNQDGAVIYNTASLDSLKQYLAVTANYSDGTSEVLSADAYTLAGTLTVGTSTVTASYQGKTDAFDVTVMEAPTLSSISAVYTQSGTVYNTDDLDSLKSDLVVTAHYEDSTTAIVTSYTLSGTLTVGTATITVSYGGFTDEFNVIVTRSTDWESGVPYDMTDGITSNYYLNKGTETSYNGWSISPYMKCNGAFVISNTAFMNPSYNALYNANKEYLGHSTNNRMEANKYMNYDDFGATFIRVSAATNSVGNAVITPYLLANLTETTVWETDTYYKADFSINGYINASTGQVIESTSQKCTGFLNCYNSTKITTNAPYNTWQEYSFYDSDKQYISTVEVALSGSSDTSEITVPSNARYVRISKTYPSLGICFKLG